MRSTGQDQHDTQAWPRAARPVPRRPRAACPLDHDAFLAALRVDRIDAPWVIDGSINGTLFRIRVERFLLPTLRPGDVVVLDNLGSHKGKAVRRAIRSAGVHLFFLPPYSPDLTPIEMVFANLKALLRKADERSIAAGSNRIGFLLAEFSPTKCAAYFRHSGLAS